MSERGPQGTRGPGRGAADAVDLAWPDDDPELLPFLPLVYVAWSDGVLTDVEIQRIAKRLDTHDWLDETARGRVRAWLDPSRPPAPSSLEALKTRIRSVSTGGGSETLRSLVALGLDLVRADGGPEEPWDAPAARAALDELEEALGVLGGEAARDLLEEEPALAAPVYLDEPPFEVGDLRDYLDRPHGELRRAVLDALRAPRFRFAHDLDKADYRRRVMEALGSLAEMGWGGLAFPEEHGGSGDAGSAIAVFETLAFGDHSLLVKYGVQFGLFGGSILHLGTERHHRDLLPAVARLELPGCYAMTETGHGSNVRELETVARYEPETGEFVVHTPLPRARKDWTGGAADHARVAVVFAQLEAGGERHGVHAFLVPLRDDDGRTLPGIHIEDCGLKEGLNGVDNGRITFDHVRIPSDALLDRFGSVDAEGRYRSPVPGAGRRFFTMLGTLVSGRISVAAASVSAAKTGLAVAVPYSARRRQFGPAGGPEVPLLHYRIHQRLLLPRLATTYALHFAVRDLTRRHVESQAAEGGERAAREVEAQAAGLKAIASRHCVETLQACREACGGQGYLAANRFGRLKADTDVFTTFEGANPVLLQLVAKALLSEYREEMGDLRLWDVVRLLTDQAQTRLAALNPVTGRRTDEEHLRDPDFQAAAFRYREERLLASVARRLKAYIDGGADSFVAMNRCQDHLVALARAHAERLTVESFHEAVARAPAPGLSETLKSLSDLHALSLLESAGGWYQESGYFEAPKSRAVRAQVNALCAEVSDIAVALVEAFGIPSEVLEAPAATGGSP